jgi:hypothetical protein
MSKDIDSVDNHFANTDHKIVADDLAEEMTRTARSSPCGIVPIRNAASALTSRRGARAPCLLDTLKDTVKEWTEASTDQVDPIIMIHKMNALVENETLHLELQEDLCHMPTLGLTIAAVVLYLTSNGVVEPNLNNCVALLFADTDGDYGGTPPAHTLH